MPLIKMLLQFLGLWMLAFPVGLFAAAWYNVSDTLMTYGLLVIALPLVVRRFPTTQQRPFSRDEQFPAIVGLTTIILGVNLAFTTLFTPSHGAYSAWLNPPLPLNVIQGFITLQTPLYAVMSWLCIRAANTRFLLRHAPQADRPLTNPPPTSEEDAHRERSSGRHRRDRHDYTLKRPR